MEACTAVCLFVFLSLYISHFQTEFKHFQTGFKKKKKGICVSVLDLKLLLKLLLHICEVAELTGMKRKFRETLESNRNES